MKPIVLLSSSAARLEPAAMPTAPGLARIDGEQAILGRIATIALAPTLPDLWEGMRTLVLELGCPAMALVDLAARRRTAAPLVATAEIRFRLDGLRRKLMVAQPGPSLIDRQTLALPAFGPHGLEAALVLRLAVPEYDVPDWSPHLMAAFHLAYARHCQLAPEEKADADSLLSEREREIMHWVMRGKSNNVIGEILGISPSTVDTYMRRIFRKLDVGDRTSAAMRAVAIGEVA